MKKAVFALAILLIAALATYPQVEAGDGAYDSSSIRFADSVNVSYLHSIHKFSIHKSHRHNSSERVQPKSTFACEEQIKEKTQVSLPYSVNFADLTAGEPCTAAVSSALYKDIVNLTILKSRK